MGVKGLLPILQSITRPAPLERYRGLTVAVDAMSWLHKGVYAGDVKSMAKNQQQEREWKRCQSVEAQNDTVSDVSSEGVARRLDFDGMASRDNQTTASQRRCTNSKQRKGLSSLSAAASSKCVSYAMRNAQTLRRDFDMDVILVIDGGSLPSKSEIDKKRAKDRAEAFRDALTAEARGDSRVARRLFARACSVTHEMRKDLVSACQKTGMRFIVAPYEADAQMAKLAHSGVVDLVITEDSDLLAYGCPRILFKVDFETKRGEEVQLMRDLAVVDSPCSFRNWTHDMFVYMCILSGCDYCDGVPGVGIKISHKLVRVHRTPSKIFNALRVAGRLPKNFEENFRRAYRTFRHQRVYCIEGQRVEPLLPIDRKDLTNRDEDAKTIWPFVGPWIEPDLARGIATGVMHPVKKIPWESCLSTDSVNRPENSSLMSSSFNPRSLRKSAPSFHDDKENGGGKCGKNATGNGKIEYRKCSPLCQSSESPSKKNLFAFFPSKKRRRGDTTSDGSSESENADDSGRSRPPLQDVFINGQSDSSAYTKSDVASPLIITTTQGRAQAIPIHFDDYSSQLVGQTFQTLSRKNRQRRAAHEGRRDISSIFRRILSKTAAPKRSKNSRESNENGHDATNDAPNVEPVAGAEDQRDIPCVPSPSKNTNEHEILRQGGANDTREGHSSLHRTLSSRSIHCTDNLCMVDETLASNADSSRSSDLHQPVVSVSSMEEISTFHRTLSPSSLHHSHNLHNVDGNLSSNTDQSWHCNSHEHTVSELSGKGPSEIGAEMSDPKGQHNCVISPNFSSHSVTHAFRSYKTKPMDESQDSEIHSMPDIDNRNWCVEGSTESVRSSPPRSCVADYGRVSNPLRKEALCAFRDRRADHEIPFLHEVSYDSMSNLLRANEEFCFASEEKAFPDVEDVHGISDWREMGFSVQESQQQQKHHSRPDNGGKFDEFANQTSPDGDFETTHHGRVGRSSTDNALSDWQRAAEARSLAEVAENNIQIVRCEGHPIVANPEAGYSFLASMESFFDL